jgi:hypothetical protein
VNEDNCTYASKVSPEVNTEKSKYLLLSCYQNTGQNHDIKIAFENMAQFKYLGMTVTNKNLIEEDIKRKLNFGDMPSIQNL